MGALLLIIAIAGPALAQSPSPTGTEEATATAAASPAGQPTTQATQPDTATGDPRATSGGDFSPIAFLLLGIGAVAAALVYLGMRGSELRRQPANTDRNPPA